MSNFAQYPSLKNRGVIITGGAGGIGAVLVAEFAAQGARVGFIDRDREAAQALLADLSGLGAHDPVFSAADLREIDQLQRATTHLQDQVGPVGVLINNAAYDLRCGLGELTPRLWDEQMAVNLRPYCFTVQAVAPAMARAGGGSIVQLGSIAGMKFSAGLPAYVAAKSAISGLTKGLAAELGLENIRVNCVVPGWVLTERQRKIWGQGEALQQVLARQCLKQTIRPVDVARLVLWLAADDSRMCSGQDFIIDGGVV